MAAQAETEIKIKVPTFVAPLYQKGYTVAEAARLIGCTAPHLRRALQGERVLSEELKGRLNSLPKKQLRLLGR